MFTKKITLNFFTTNIARDNIQKFSDKIFMEAYYTDNQQNQSKWNKN